MISAEKAASLLDNLPERDAAPWFEVGPQEHGRSDVETMYDRYGPMDRATAEMFAAAPELVHTIILMDGFLAAVAKDNEDKSNWIRHLEATQKHEIAEINSKDEQIMRLQAALREVSKYQDRDSLIEDDILWEGDMD